MTLSTRERRVFAQIEDLYPHTEAAEVTYTEQRRRAREAEADRRWRLVTGFTAATLITVLGPLIYFGVYLAVTHH